MKLGIILLILINLASLSGSLTKSIIVYIKINCLEEISASLSIHDPKPLMEIERKTELMGIKDGYAEYKSTFSFSREPSIDEINRLVFTITQESSLMTPCVVRYAEFLWSEVKDNQVKITLRNGYVLLPGVLDVDERVLCVIKSQSGFYKQDIIFAGDKGELWVNWEATYGKSSIRIARGKESKNGGTPWTKWKEWEFDLVTMIGELKLVEVTTP